MPEEQVVVDLSKAIEQGVAIKVGNDLTIGAVKDPPKQEHALWARKVQEWDGQPPTNTDGKTAQYFPIRDTCGSKVDNEGKKLQKPCDLQLLVIKIKDLNIEKDSNQHGVQLDYDEKHSKYFQYCTVHGPFPQGGDYGSIERAKLKLK